MNEPVKTTLLKAIETVLGTIPGLPTVRREYDLPFDLDQVETPALFFWEDPEDLEEDNLMARNILHLSLAVFMKLPGNEVPEYQPDTSVILKEIPDFQRFADQTDILAGQIHRLMTDKANLATWQALGLLDLEPRAQSKALASEFYGEMVLTYRLTYWHRLGDATSLNLQ